MHFVGHPGEALDKPREIFNNPVRYEQVFRSDLSTSQLLLPYLIFRESDVLTRERPEYVLPNSDGFSIKTAHIRFAMVNTVGRMLSSLAGLEPGYLAADISDALVQNRDRWLPQFVERAFDRLSRELAIEARRQGTGPRSIVRRNEWMEGAIETSTEAIRERIMAQSEAGVTGEAMLLSALPFEVR